jgi:hypothetical protein
VVSSTTPAVGAAGVDPNGNVEITFSKELDAGTVNGTTVQLRNSSGPVAATVTYSVTASDRKATIVPTSPLALSTTYTIFLQGVSRVTDLRGVALASDPNSPTFTTALAPPNYACECKLWTPGAPGVGGTQSPDDFSSQGGANLALKFQSDIDGFIKGIRFYKHALNTGLHTAYLWNAADRTAPLASKPFSNESDTGWQEVRFTSRRITRRSGFGPRRDRFSRPHHLSMYRCAHRRTSTEAATPTTRMYMVRPVCFRIRILSTVPITGST